MFCCGLQELWSRECTLRRDNSSNLSFLRLWNSPTAVCGTWEWNHCSTRRTLCCIAVSVWSTSDLFFKISAGEGTTPLPGKLFPCFIFLAVALSVTRMFHCAAAARLGAVPGPGTGSGSASVPGACSGTTASARLEGWRHLGMLLDCDAGDETNTEQGFISQCCLTLKASCLQN